MMSLPALINASAEYRLACCDIELLTIKGRKSNISEAGFTNGTRFLVRILSYLVSFDDDSMLSSCCETNMNM